MLFILDPKRRKIEMKRIHDKITRFVVCQIMGGLSYYMCIYMYMSDKQNYTKIYKFVV